MNKAFEALVGAFKDLLKEIWSGYALPAGLLALASSWVVQVAVPGFYYYFIPGNEAQTVLAIVFIFFLMGFWYLLLSIIQGARKGENPMVTVSFTKVFAIVFLIYLAASYQASMSETPFWRYFVSESLAEISYAIGGVFAFGLAVAFVQMGVIRGQNQALSEAVEQVEAWGEAEADTEAEAVIGDLRGGLVRGRLERFAKMAERGAPIDRDSVSAVDTLRIGLGGSYARYFSSILTLMGLFGTFVGLTGAILGVEGVIDTLSNFQDLTRLQTEMKTTLGGMRTAFSTSLAGLASAMILGIVLMEFSGLQARFVARLEDETTRSLVPFFEQWSRAVSAARRPTPPVARPSARPAVARPSRPAEAAPEETEPKP